MKLTRHTSFDDLKASKNLFQVERSDSERESDLKEFISLLKNHSSFPNAEAFRLDKSLNHQDGGK
jgi:hypothetical protein